MFFYIAGFCVPVSPANVWTVAHAVRVTSLCIARDVQFDSDINISYTVLCVPYCCILVLPVYHRMIYSVNILVLLVEHTRSIARRAIPYRV